MSEQPSLFESANPKLMFIFGVVTGIAIAAVLVSGSLLRVTDGLQLGLEQGGGEEETATNKQAAEEDDTGSAAAAAPSTEIPAVTSDDHILGSADAKVVLVEYSDFQCPFCQRHHPNMQKLMVEFGDDVAWVYRHFPLSFHPEAFPAAVASECADEQGKFWEFGEKLFDNQDDLGEELYLKLAGELGLNVNGFEGCLASGKYDGLIDDQTIGGAAAGVNGTPATFINGQLVSGAVPYATLKSVVEAELE